MNMDLTSYERLPGIEEAKSRMLSLWEYLAEHPAIPCMEALPDELWDGIKDLPRLCYLRGAGVRCKTCPVGNCREAGSPYGWWRRARIQAGKENGNPSLIREKAAREMARNLRSWGARHAG